MKHRNCLLTITGKDRPGIIAGVTGILYDLRCNLEDISMTILEGEFAMMLVFHAPAEVTTVEGLSRRLAPYQKKWGLNWHLTPICGKLRRGDASVRGTAKYLISALGRDKTGIVYKISRTLAKNRLNITDMNSRILGHGSRCLYSMLLEVDIPGHFSMTKIRRELQRLEKDLKIEIQIKPVERIQL